MNSLFIRNFVIYALVICLGFGILGSAFVYQVNRFALEEKQAQLTDAADRALQSTSTYFELEGSDDWKDKFNTSYRVSMHMIAKDCDGTILVGSREGDLLFIATRDGCYSQLDNGLQLPPAALETVLREGSYTQSSNFYGFLAEVNYVMGRTVEEDGAVYFPDAPTARGTRHVLELCRCAEAGLRAWLLFVIQMENVRYFAPNDRTDPQFGQALRYAAQHGVELLAYDCRVTETDMTLRRPVEIRL